MKNEPSHFEIFLMRLAFFLNGRSVYQTFADRLPLSGKEQVLDFRCGMGRVAYYVVQKLPYGQLTCLDPSERWLNACRKTLRNYKNINYVQGEFPDYSNECFDVVYCHFVLHDISDRELEKAIPALAMVLKSGGLFFFREPLCEMKKINLIKGLAEMNRLILKDSRITDIPLMGNSLENLYMKQ